MNITNLRMRYTQLIFTCVLCVSLYAMVMTLSLPGGIFQFEKNFLGRGFLITSFTQMKLTLGDRVFQQAVIGKQGWWEYTGDRNLDDYQNSIIISQKAFQITQLRIQKLYEELQKRNITLLLVIAPNKATIYPDKLPDEIQKLRQESNLDILTGYLKSHGPPILIDLRPALLNGRKKQDIYHRTDTHWNSYGSFLAYIEIIKILSKTYPQLVPKSVDDFNIQRGQPQLLDISQIIGATSVRESGFNFIPKKNDGVRWTVFNSESPMPVSTTPRKNLPTLLMYMDSFGNGLKNFIAPDFHKVTFIPTDSKYPDLFSLELIDRINPDIVIVEVVERSFSNQALDDFLQQLLSEQ